MLFTLPPTCPLEFSVTLLFTFQSLLLIGNSWDRCLTSSTLLLQHLKQYLAHSRCPDTVTGKANAGLDGVGEQHPQGHLSTNNQHI